MPVPWKIVGLAGVAGVAATGVVVVRKRRAQHNYEPAELRERLRDRLSEVSEVSEASEKSEVSEASEMSEVATQPTPQHAADDDDAGGARGGTDLGAGMFSQAFWDERYSSRPALWSGKPNPHLVDQAEELSGGRALDVGSGEGADAIWLAQRGWQVTAVDVSPVALARGAQHAAEVGPEVADRIQWRQEDVLRWGPNPACFDLICVQFMHLPPEHRAALVSRLAAGVVPGGTLLIVGHHPSDLQTTVPRSPRAELLFTASEVGALLDPAEWDIVVDAAPERSTTDPSGNIVAIHDALLRARRRV